MLTETVVPARLKSNELDTSGQTRARPFFGEPLHPIELSDLSVRFKRKKTCRIGTFFG